MFSNESLVCVLSDYTMLDTTHHALSHPRFPYFISHNTIHCLPFTISPSFQDLKENERVNFDIYFNQIPRFKGKCMLNEPICFVFPHFYFLNRCII